MWKRTPSACPSERGCRPGRLEIDHTTAKQIEKSLGIDAYAYVNVRGAPNPGPPIGNDHAAREFALRLDIDAHGLRFDQGTIERDAYGEGIVQEKYVAAQARPVEREHAIADAAEKARAQVGAAAEEQFQTLPAELDLVRNIEPDEGQRDSAVNNLTRGVRIGKKVELGRRAYVAVFPDRATHGHDLFEGPKPVRIFAKSDRRVGKRADRYQGDLARKPARQRHYLFRGGNVVRQIARRRGSNPSAQPVVAVNIGGKYRRCE